MKSILKFTFCFFAILFASALLAPFLYRVFPKLSEFLSHYISFIDADAFDWKFERIYNRLVMIFSLAALFFAVRAKKFDFPKESIRWDKKISLQLFAFGFLWGMLLLVAIVVIKFLLGIIEWRMAEETLGFWLERIGMSLLAAMVIGIIEEIFFRGFCFVTVLKRTKQNLLVTILIVNIFYAILHYVQGKKPFIGPEPSIIDGLKLMAAPFMSLADWQPILPGIVGLFIYGVILSYVYLKTRSLYPCIGIHAGCVFFLKVDGALFFHHAVNPLLYGSNNGYDGILGWITLIIVGWAMILFFSKKPFVAKLAMGLIFFLATASSDPSFSFAETNASSQTQIEELKEEPLSALEMWKRKKQMLEKYEVKTIESKDPLREPQEKEILETVQRMPAKLENEAIKVKEKEMVKSVTLGGAVQKISGLEKKEKKEGVNSEKFNPDVDEEKAFSSRTKSIVEKQNLNLIENLEQAKIVNIDSAYQNVEGVWNGEAFIFKDQDAAKVDVREQVIGGEIQKGVYIEALPNMMRRIRFEGVESGKKLILGYGITDKGFEKDQNLTIYLKIWIGQKMIKRIAIFNEKGWKQEEIDLGPASFLKNPLTVTFDISADDVEKRYLMLDAKIS
jgi:membrane protease YdiL (CAAX protease family)